MGFWDILAVLLGGGSVLYLLIEKLFGRHRESAEVDAQKVDNYSAVADLYEKIDGIVSSKTERLEEKTDRLSQKIDVLQGEVLELRSLRCSKLSCPDRQKFDKTSII